MANLPYNVSVPVLIHLLTVLPSLEKGLVMVQAEVADRLAASPGCRTYGIPSVKAAWFADVAGPGRSAQRLLAGAQSRLRAGRLDPARAAGDEGHREQVFAVVDAAFAQRRKTLRGALSEPGRLGGAAENALRAAGVDPTARGEVLDVAAYARIAEALDRGAPA